MDIDALPSEQVTEVDAPRGSRPATDVGHTVEGVPDGVPLGVVELLDVGVYAVDDRSAVPDASLVVVEDVLRCDHIARERISWRGLRL